MSTATRARDDGDQMPDAGATTVSARFTTRVACHRYRSERLLRADAYVRTRHCTTPQASEHCLQRCLTGQTLTDCESSAHRRFRAAGAAPSATRNENLHECPGCKAGNGAPARTSRHAKMATGCDIQESCKRHMSTHRVSTCRRPHEQATMATRCWTLAQPQCSLHNTCCMSQVPKRAFLACGRLCQNEALHDAPGVRTVLATMSHGSNTHRL